MNSMNIQRYPEDERRRDEYVCAKSGTILI